MELVCREKINNEKIVIPLRAKIHKSAQKYLITLPARLNILWQQLHRKNLTVIIIYEQNNEGDKK